MRKGKRNTVIKGLLSNPWTMMGCTEDQQFYSISVLPSETQRCPVGIKPPAPRKARAAAAQVAQAPGRHVLGTPEVVREEPGPLLAPPAPALQTSGLPSVSEHPRSCCPPAWLHAWPVWCWTHLNGLRGAELQAGFCGGWHSLGADPGAQSHVPRQEAAGPAAVLALPGLSPVPGSLPSRRTAACRRAR